MATAIISFMSSIDPITHSFAFNFIISCKFPHSEEEGNSFLHVGKSLPSNCTFIVNERGWWEFPFFFFSIFAQIKIKKNS